VEINLFQKGDIILSEERTLEVCHCELCREKPD